MNHEEHEDHETKPLNLDHETKPLFEYRMRLHSPLTPRAERAMSDTIGCAIRVHRALGPGFLESIYRKAMYIELDATGVSYEFERPVSVKYRDLEITGQRVDLIVEGQIVVELKAVIHLDDVHRAQLMSYIRTAGLRGGLLINFRVPVLQQGLKRIVV